MSTPLLKRAYSDELFKQEGNELIQLLSDHLSSHIGEKTDKVIEWSTPNDEYEFWEQFAKEKHSTKNLFETILNRSIATHNPKYIGHQISPTVPVSGLATLLSAMLNNGMAVYEMGAAATAIEKLVVNEFTKAIGYNDNADGFLTSGGTLANLTALIAARKSVAKDDVWNDGHTNKLAVLVSEEAHYCIDRAARIMGLGDGGIIKVPVNENFKINTSQLETAYNNAKNNGYEVIAVVGSAPSTSSGVHDDLEALAEFAQQKNIWFHVDGAHGGAAVFSSKYKYLLNGIEQADSVAIDGHKMMATSSITTALLFKRSNDTYTTFSQKAHYLWDKNDDLEWYNLAKRTFECTKSMMSIRFFSIINAYGTQFFDDYVTTLYDLGKTFADIIESNEEFELAMQPETNILCFRVKGDLDSEEIGNINQQIRRQLLEDGEFYIVSTYLKGVFYLRVTIMNVFTNESHFKALLNKIISIKNNSSINV
ncbi:pyridoxal phosphate-dependent decarboxylase family protein [Spongiivirga citrea]|uniref:Aminotransferase class I/II-fold pyridoxal phosphate-dependent enzyme n=1 Tax=Spongiivirga citrea TaxID=1481457 RepID=A0A6M0CKA4_9FLAO|nr:aminotransferase class I/II-fold pyridoxal phosphate-dependent enzyme [Spongiivirga citrea]NER18052.1 aminotransferase class I/II-fold pyridoxal phosphate-dependent enzyme [Spongiivirga citrea]